MLEAKVQDQGHRRQVFSKQKKILLEFFWAISKKFRQSTKF